MALRLSPAWPSRPQDWNGLAWYGPSFFFSTGLGWALLRNTILARAAICVFESGHGCIVGVCEREERKRAPSDVKCKGQVCRARRDSACRLRPRSKGAGTARPHAVCATPSYRLFVHFKCIRCSARSAFPGPVRPFPKRHFHNGATTLTGAGPAWSRGRSFSATHITGTHPQNALPLSDLVVRTPYLTFPPIRRCSIPLHSCLVPPCPRNFVRSRRPLFLLICVFIWVFLVCRLSCLFLLFGRLLVRPSKTLAGFLTVWVLGPCLSFCFLLVSLFGPQAAPSF